MLAAVLWFGHRGSSVSRSRLSPRYHRYSLASIRNRLCARVEESEAKPTAKKTQVRLGSARRFRRYNIYRNMIGQDWYPYCV